MKLKLGFVFRIQEKVLPTEAWSVSFGRQYELGNDPAPRLGTSCAGFLIP